MPVTASAYKLGIMSDRRPAVAGMFYESDPQRLRAQVRACFDDNEPAPAKMQWIGAITPHAGLMYSGHVAAALFARLDVPERLIILNPNHTGRGHDAAINRAGSWLMPFGPVTIDTALADALIAECPLPEAFPERARCLALAVAGKEAASKALGTGWSRGVRWRV